MAMNTDIAEVYGRHKNLKLAADELGVKWQALYVQLRKTGVQVTGDKARYGSDKDRLAARAELEFKSLVPFAVNQNSIQFQSKFDFLVGSEKVDIKASGLNQGCKKFAAKRWAFSVKKQEFCADFIVCFAMQEPDYRIFLIPGELVRNYQSISIPESKNSKSKWLQYEISKTDLTEFFTEITK
jgi:hypothetical protein